MAVLESTIGPWTTYITHKRQYLGNNFCDSLLGSDFGRTDFSRIFIFEPPDFFADFVAGFFLLISVGKKCPAKSSRKIPGKILQENPPKLIQRKSPTTFCREAGATVTEQLPKHIYWNSYRKCNNFIFVVSLP